MTIGCMVWELPDLTLLEHILWIAGYGFDAVDLHVNPNLGQRAVDPTSLSASNCNELRRTLQQFSTVNIHAAFDIALVTEDGASRRHSLQRLSDTTKLAANLGASTVTVHKGPYCRRTPHRQMRKRFAQSLRDIGRIAHDQQTTICLEIVADYDLVSDLDSPLVGICLDTGHVALSSDNPPVPQLIRELGDNIRHVHVHDCDGDNDHIPIGEGNLWWSQIIAALGAISYTDTLTLEVNPAENGAGGIIRSKRTLENYLRFDEQ